MSGHLYAYRIDHCVSEPCSLPEAMRAVYGCGGALILRTDGTLVVRHAGSASAIEHVPSGRRVERRLTRRAGRRWQADPLTFQGSYAGRAEDGAQ